MLVKFDCKFILKPLKLKANYKTDCIYIHNTQKEVVE